MKSYSIEIEKKFFKKMTFFGQHGVENFFSYFSLNVSTEVFKISHSKKISLEKNFYLKIAVSALPITFHIRTTSTQLKLN